jgi:nitrate/nitrite transporter NarK
MDLGIVGCAGTVAALVWEVLAGVEGFVGALGSLGSFIKPSIFQESAVNARYFVYNAARALIGGHGFYRPDS